MANQIPVTQLKGIGEKTAGLYEKLGIRTVSDLVNYLPRDYECFESPVSVAQLKTGVVQSTYVMVTGMPLMKKVRNLTITHVDLRDSTGALSVTFFNAPYIAKVLKPGMHFVLRGVAQKRGISMIMEHPRVFSFQEYEELQGVLQPRYALTKGLTNSAVKKAVKLAFEQMEWEEEYYPQKILNRAALITEKQALQNMHFPNSREEVIPARNRMVFDEFFTFLFHLRKNKDACEGIRNRYVFHDTKETGDYLNTLPFELTVGQKKTWQDIRNDMGGKLCMNRLVQGDVGSGKTVIAILALLLTASNGYQGALMAPTEVLAMQHYEGILKDTTERGLCFKPVLLVGSMTAKEKKEAYAKIASGEANLIIGTHALIQEKVTYKNLALVVTDEQHRFGVRQRETLAEKGEYPHVLVMSATPIPRTLAIILYGDLQISVIKELPANRLPIKNCVVGTVFRPKAYEFIAKEVAAGHQAYVICPQVEEGELEELENVVEYAQKLKNALPPSVRVQYLHGKMKPAQKNTIMEDFGAGKIDVLVSTTVIEVGINVPNATVMMVENAERFGLAQLHQLRGRVGRGDAQSYCIFVSTNENKETMDRLQILNQSNDGFHIASEDLKLRGPGDLFGIRQSGEFAFRIGDIYQDAELLQLASELVDEILSEDPKLAKPEYAKLKDHFAKYEKNMIDFRSI